VYTDAAFTYTASANLVRDLNFKGGVIGNIYAQPLYIEGGPSGPMIIAVTEANNVYALNATTGTIIWQRDQDARARGRFQRMVNLLCMSRAVTREDDRPNLVEYAKVGLRGP